MKTQNRNLMKGLILLAGVLSPLGLHAQTFLSTPWTQGSPAVTTGTDTNGTFLSTAPLNSSVTFNSTETSTSTPQFLWVPALSALRVGTFSSAPSTTTMGQYSVALGDAAVASGEYSVALGQYDTASASYSTAIGDFNTASGGPSIAIGNFVTASAMFANALGFGVTASATGATAMGMSTTASGTYSTATGYETSANSYDSFVVGTYNTGKAEDNVTTPSLTSWVSTYPADPLFEIGNGTSSTHSDALVVYKDGNAVVKGTTTSGSGFLTTPASVANTDIPMFTGN